MTEAATKQPTPKTFRPHVLVALAKQTEWTAGKVVAMRDVFDVIFDRMGIREDEYGTISTGRLQTHQWIGIAFRKLKLDGKTDQPSRGQWTITAEGIITAREILAAEGEAVELASDPKPASPTTANDLLGEVTAAAEAAAEGATEPEPTPDAEPEPDAEPDAEPEPDNLVELRRPDARAYHTDSHIRSLAIAATKCFGYYSSRARACKTCPLASECVQSVRAEYARIAQEIAKEKKKAEARAKAQKRVKEASSEGVSTDALLDELDQAVDSVTGRKRSTKKDRRARKASKPKWDKSKALTIKARNNPRCAKCGNAIPNGDDCLWIEEGGTFHTGCL